MKTVKQRAVIDAYEQTRSVEETCRSLGLDPSKPADMMETHRLLAVSIGRRAIDQYTFPLARMAAA